MTDDDELIARWEATGKNAYDGWTADEFARLLALARRGAAAIAEDASDVELATQRLAEYEANPGAAIVAVKKECPLTLADIGELLCPFVPQAIVHEEMDFVEIVTEDVTVVWHALPWLGFAVDIGHTADRSKIVGLRVYGVKRIAVECAAFIPISALGRPGDA